ncbi:pilus assembly protein [Rubripirellula amarantea]|nr:pilus assembly protein [Rubripirellula amarantea]
MIRHRQPLRRGTVTVEFALCAPILFVFTFASFEFSRVNSLRQTAENAVYEGCRRGIVPGATTGDVQAATTLVLDSVFTQNPTVTITPSVITEDTSTVTVSVAVPLDDNAWVIPRFFSARELTSSLTMARERGLNSSVD